MNFARSGEKASATSYRLYEDITLYLRVIIDVYSSSEVDRMYWLTDREKDFFIATVICLLDGEKSPTSEEALQIYKKHFNPSIKKVNINDYLNKLKKKGWLKYNKNEKLVEVPAIFNNIGGDRDTLDFNLRYSFQNGNGTIHR